MHHGKHVRRLNRNSAHRNSLLRNLVSSLISSGRIETTVAKAKELQPIAERLITLAKKGDSNAKRHACSYLYSRDVTIPKLFEELAPRFANRQGGYTRVKPIGSRYGDNAPMAVIEYIDGPNDLKRNMVTKAISRIMSKEVSAEELLNVTPESLNLSPALARDLKKVQFANSISAAHNKS
ncbi:ribosomal protein L17 [Syncephalastrum racemosum]|uniref:Ribosomal protein L17 n=1 Tax=Syncephalastrum racemosum TaxID=13706 RepID=A0A1X2HMF4_SYNRA|nr:ribosomal protein L17 [Syncephalastrum racemosum]